jgi:O-antigen ligase
MFLKALLFFHLMYVVNQIHLPWETGIPGVAPSNLLFVLTLLALQGKPEPARLGLPILKNALLLFFAALGFAFLWAQVRAPGDLMLDLTYLKNAIYYPLFYFLYRSCKQDEKTTRWLIIWILVIAAVAGFEAAREGFDYGFGRYNPTRRASGPFAPDWTGSNRAGVYFAMFMPMFVALALFLRRQKLWRLASVAAIVTISIGTLATYSRQAYFLVLLGIPILLVRKSLVFAVALSLLLVSLAGYLPDSVFQRVEETSQTGKHGEEQVDVSTASRWEIWAGAMGMLRDNPIGAGLNRFKREIGKYCSYKGYDAHNFYVLTLAETGPQGLIAWLLAIWTLFRLAAFLRSHAPPGDREAKALALGFTVSTLCMALGGLYGSPHLEGAVMATYWALAGLLERYITMKMDGTSEQPVALAPPLSERFRLIAHALPGRRDQG